MNTPFPAKTAIASYQALESMLTDVLAVIPYCPEHETVWSPALGTILCEACMQLDSLWRFDAWQSKFVQAAKRKKDITIQDYFKWFSARVQRRWLVFWGDEPLRFVPFEEWEGRKTFHSLDWWTAYNGMKHDRLTNRKDATLKRAVRAAAALFLAIVRTEGCREEVAHAGWLSAPIGVAHNPAAWLGEDSRPTCWQFVAAESGLFSYPVGWGGVAVDKHRYWDGPASSRFRSWFDDYEQPGEGNTIL